MFFAPLPSLRKAALMLAFCAVCLLAALPQPAAAQNYVFTFGGTFASSFSEGYGFDGTNDTDTPPPVLNLTALKGGTFTATLTFPAVVPPSNPAFNFASYRSDPSYRFQFRLYDAAGNVVHEGSGTSPSVTISNNVPVREAGSPVIVGYYDGVEFTGEASQVSGLTLPPPLYSAQPDVFYGLSSFRFNNFSDLTRDFLSNLSLPTDAAPYLSFPNRRFSTSVFWGDGDYNDQVNPFQYVQTDVSYNITSVRVAAVVPEPSALTLFFIGGTLVLLHGLRRCRLAR